MQKDKTRKITDIKKNLRTTQIVMSTSWKSIGEPDTVVPSVVLSLRKRKKCKNSMKPKANNGNMRSTITQIKHCQCGNLDSWNSS